MTAVILAAGLSTRYGGKKLLARIEERPMVMHIAQLILSVGFQQILFVYSDEEVAAVVSEFTVTNQNFKLVYNPSAAEGLSTSVKAAVNAAPDSESYLFFPSDQPFIDRTTINLLLDAYSRRKGSIIVPLYQGRRGNPVLFSGIWKTKLLSLKGDTGGRDIIRDHPEEVYELEIGDSRIGFDIDTPEDYALSQAYGKEGKDV